MKILLSKQNLLKESLTYIDSVTKKSEKVTASSGFTFEIDLFKLSLLSPLLRCIMDSLGVPDSLNHLLDINIIFPDFSEEALTVVNQSFFGFGSDMRVGMILYEELQLLVNALGISVHPSLSILEDQIKNEKNNKTNNNAEQIVKFEPMVVDLTDIKEDKFEGNLVDESACSNVGHGGTPLAYLSNSKGGNTMDDDNLELPVDNSTVQMIFTLSTEDRNEFRNELRKLMVSKVNNGRKLWSCTVCNKFKKEALEKLVILLNSTHTPYIFHRCDICFKKFNMNVFKTELKFLKCGWEKVRRNMFKTQGALKSHMVEHRQV